MTDCASFSLNPFLHRPWPEVLFITVMSVALCLFLVWLMWDSRRRRLEYEAREAVRTERWAARDPEGYAAVMQRRAEEDALVTARLAQYQPWWRRIHRRSQA